MMKGVKDYVVVGCLSFTDGDLVPRGGGCILRWYICR